MEMFLSAHKKYPFYDLFETQKSSTCQRLKEGASGRCLLMSEENILMITDCFKALFAKLRKATISFVISVFSSVREEQLGSHFTDFHEIWYLRIFRKFVEKIKVSLKSNKNNGHFT
jgi:hypothetical protein